MRILFMGTPDFAVSSLDKLNKKHEILEVFTKIDKPNMRGKKIKYTPVKEYAIENNIPVYQPNSLKNNEVVEHIKQLNPELIVVVAYGKIIPNEIIEIPKYGIINVHSSLLPKYRGAAPIHAALINGEERTGVSIMYIVEELDAGDVITTRETKIKEEDNLETLHDRLKELGAEALEESVELIEKNMVERKKQDHSKATFVKPFKKEDCRIDWNKKEREIFNFVRGMNPFPTAFTTLEDKMIKIYKVKENKQKYDQGIVGEIVDIKKGEGFIVKTGDGSIVMLEVKPENKKLLNGNDTINGQIFKVGDILK